MSERDGVSDGAGWTDGDESVVRERCRALFDAVDDGVCHLDADGYFVAVNDALLARTGYGRDDLLGEHVSLLTGDRQADRLEAAIAGRGDSDRDATLELPLRTADGATVDSEFRLSPVDADGAGGAVAVVRDGTATDWSDRQGYVPERQGYGSDRQRGGADRQRGGHNGRRDGRAERAEERDEQAERRRERAEGRGDDSDGRRDVPGASEPVPSTDVTEILDRISDGFFALDGEFRFTHVNDRAQELINPAGRDLVGESLWEAFPEASERAFGTHYERAMETQETVSFEAYYPDPLDAWFEARAYPSETGLSVYFRDVTERKERRRERERYATIVEEIDDGVYVVDEDSTILMVNQAYADMLGYEKEELIGEHASAVVDESVIAQTRELQAATVEGRIDRPSMEAEMRTADGETVPVEATFAPLPGGAVGHRVGVVRDVSRRKERERALYERERQLSTLIENVPGMVYRCRNERSWPMTFVSEGCRDLTGYDPAALEAGDLSFGDDVVHPDDRDELWAEVQEGLDDDGAFHVTYRIVTPDGEVRWVLERGRRVDGEGRVDGESRAVESGDAAGRSGPEGGDPATIEGVIIDVTDRKRLETELDEVYGRVTDAFYALDDEWRITYVNEKTASLVGHSTDELQGEVIWDAFPELAGSDVEDRYREAMETQEPVSFERDSDLLDGWVSVRAYPSETGLSVYFEDVTERKEHERELEARSAAMAASIEGMAILDENEEYAFVNQAHADIYGYDDPEAFLGETWRLCYADDEVDRIEREAMTELFETGSWRGEATGQRKDGSTFPQEVSLTALDDGQLICVVRDLTERKERERELARFEVLFTESRDVNGVLAPDGTFEYVTPSAARVLGYEADDLVGEDAFSFVHPDDRERVAREFGRLVEEPDRTPTVEYRFRHADGSWIVLETRGRNLLDEPDIEGIVVYTRDVTERVERERELERKERRYQAVFEDPNILVGLLEPDGTVIDVNETAMDYVDASLADVVGEPFPETPWWGEGDDLTADVAEWVERAAAGEYVDFEADLSRPDGERYTLSGYFRPVTNDAGEVQSIIVSDRDISERVARERELEESERRYRTLVENFPNGAVGLFDEDLEYTAIGGELLEPTGVSADDRIGSSVYDIYPDHVVDEVEPHFEAALDGEANAFEVEFHDRHLFAYTLPVRDADDEVFAGMIVVRDVTERREMERDLRESEAKFRMLAENLEEVVWMASADAGEIIYVNPAYEDVWGRAVDELYDDPLAFLEGVHPADRERVRDAFTGLPESEFDEEFRIRRPDGEVRWLHVTGAQVRDEDGEIVRIVGIGDDVTERVERQRELEESERRYRALAENFPNGGVGLFDEDLRYTLVTGTMWDDIAVDAADLKGERVQDALPPETADDVEPLFRGALAGETGSVVSRLGGRDYRVWATPLRDRDGAITGGQSFAVDVTEQLERERELERRARQQQVVADLGQYALEAEDLDDLMREAAAQVADVLDNEHAKVLDLDDGERELLLRQGVGWDEGIVGTATVDADENSQAGFTLHSEEPVVVEDLASETRFSGPALLTSHDVTSGISTIIGSVDDPWGILGTHDTARRAFSAEDVNFVKSVANVLAEAIERHQHQAELEALVADLEESNERLEQFAYAASHDLQEPLRMVSSYLRLIERRCADDLDEEAEEFIEFAVDGADRMREMIEALLAYSRVETRGDPFEPVALDDVLADVRQDLRVRIQESDATVTAEALPTVRGDGDQLRQVFQNLLDNAIEYSGDDPPDVHVGAERDGDVWVISVRDEGIGIEPDQAEEVFKVFKRLHTQDEHPGTGVGLALCERIVERHGGDVWVESESGDGSTFYFTLPAVGGDKT